MNRFRHFPKRLQRALVQADLTALEEGRAEVGLEDLLRALRTPREFPAIPARAELEHQEDLVQVLERFSAGDLPDSLRNFNLEGPETRPGPGQAFRRGGLLALGLFLAPTLLAAPEAAPGTAPGLGDPPSLLLGQRELARGDAREAVRHGVLALEGSTASGPKARAYLLLGKAYSTLSESTLARESLDRAKKLWPKGQDSTEVLYQLALLDCRQLPSPEVFAEALEEFLRQDPMTLDEDSVYFFLGFTRGLRLQGSIEGVRALSTLESSQAGSYRDDARFHRALILALALERKPEAQAILADFETDFPSSPLLGQARMLASILALQAGDPKAGLRALAEVPPEDPSARTAAFLRAVLAAYFAQAPEEARASLQLLVRQPGPWFSFALYHQALIRFSFQGEFAAALEDLDQLEATESAHEVPEGWRTGLRRTLETILSSRDPLERRFLYARSFERHGHYPRAQALYRTLLERPLPEGLKGRVHLRLAALDQDDRGRLAGPEAELERALETPLAPSLEAETRWRLARSRLARGADPSQAFDSMQEGQEAFARAALRGLLLKSKGHGPERIRVLFRLIRTLPAGDPERPRVLAALAQALEAEGRLESSLELYHQVLPDAPELADRIQSLDVQRRLRALEARGSKGLDPASQLTFALTLLEASQPDRAEEVLDQLRRDESDPTLSARAAALLVRLRRARKDRPERIREALDDALSRPELEARERLLLTEIQARREADFDPEASHAILIELVREGFGASRLLPEILTKVWEEDGPKKSLALFRQLHPSRPEGPELLQVLAKLHEDLDELGRSRDLTQRLVDEFPDHAAAGPARAWLAQDFLDRLRELSPQELPLATRIQEVEDFLSRTPPALVETHRQDLEDLLEAGETQLSPEESFRLGRFYQESLDRPLKAAEFFQKASLGKNRETSRQALLALSQTLRDLDQTQEALAALETLARRSPSDRARALLETARIERDILKEPDRVRLTLGQIFRAPPDPSVLEELAQELLEDPRMQALPLETRRDLLADLRKSLGRGPRRYQVELAWAQDLLAQGRKKAAAEVYLEAARMASDSAGVVESTERGLGILFELGQSSRVIRLAKETLRNLEGPVQREGLQLLIQKSSARLQVAQLLKGLDWTDPESPSNLQRLFRAGKLLVSPLEDTKQAALRLEEVLQLFPGTPEARQARQLMAKLPLLEASKQDPSRDSSGASPLARDKTEIENHKDRLNAARFLEHRLEDHAQAKRVYRQVFEQEDSVIGIYAGLSLLRLLALDPQAGLDAEKVAFELQRRSIPGALQARFQARMRTLLDREEWLKKRVRIESGKARPEDLAAMVRQAAGSYQDSILAMKWLRKVSDREEKTRLALEISELLDPAASVGPEAPAPEDFLDLAVQTAPTASWRAKALLLRAQRTRRSPDPRPALEDLAEAARSSPGSGVAERALLDRSSLLLELEEQEEEALRDLRTVLISQSNRPQSGPTGEIASQQAKELVREIEIQRIDQQAFREGSQRPDVHLQAARLLTRKYEALSEALEHYRTFLRGPTQGVSRRQAYFEASDVLSRLSRPKEAILMLERLASEKIPEANPQRIQLAIAEIHERGTGDLVEARRIYRQLLSESPRLKPAQEGLERLEGLEDRTSLEAESRGSNEPSPVLAAIEAEYLGSRRDVRGALAALQAALERSRDPEERSQIGLKIGVLEDKQERYRQALEGYEHYLAGSRPSRQQADTLLRMAHLYAEELEKPKRAHELYLRFLKGYPAHPQRVPSLVSHAKVLEALDRVQEAIQIYQIVVDSFPRSGHDEVALERLAYLKRTYFASFQEAVDAYRQLIQRFPFSQLADDAQYAIARIFEIELGDLNQARQEYEALMQRYPASEYYILAQQGLTRIARR